VNQIAAILAKIRTMIGVPDYDRYVEHCRTHHPDAAPMTRDQFITERMEKKYSSSGTRCC